MWGWLARIADGVSSFVEKITTLPALIAGALKSFFDDVVSAIKNLPSLIAGAFNAMLTSIKEGINTVVGWVDTMSTQLTSIAHFITNTLPRKVHENIVSVFVPDQEALKEDITNLLDNLKHTFNLTIDSDKWLVDSFEEKAFEDIEGNYYISGVGNFKLKFFDTSFLIRGVEYFRPIIRGFIVLLLCFYHYRQVLTFIGQDPSMYSNAHSTYMESKGGGK